jgi:hypothetical protein
MKSLTALFLALCAVAYAFAADVTGKWTGQLTGPDGNSFPINYTFKQDGAKLTGSTQGPDGNTIEIADGKVEGDTITFSISFEGGQGTMKISNTGTIAGDEITLKIAMAGAPVDFPPIKLTRSK